MGNQELFKEAIAEAKAIREAAITNAKAALEETLTPHLKTLLSQRLMEMEEEEDEVVSEEEEVEETQLKEAKKKKAEDDSEESEDEAEDTEEAKEDEDDEEVEMPAEEEEEVEVKDMEVEDLRQLIRDIVAQEMGGEDGMGYGEEDADMEMGDDAEMDVDMGMDMDMDAEAQPDDMVSTDDEEIDLEELLAELEGTATRRRPVYEAKKKAKAKDKVKDAKDKKEEDTEKKKLKKDLHEALKTVNVLRSELSEVNLLNAKLLYLNKVLKGSNLTEGQKAGIISAFDKASSIKEVKLVYESVVDTVKSSKKHPLKEHRGFASKSAGTAPRREVITEVDQQVRRMQKLAGIIK